ncbi:hypothetical protein PVL29_015822 [Vitis rotundifolia]|uniref:peroxidase n=1 Tax=Vitis rotundifolia TaxID=103349 RepID=A0AA39DJZ4_VITRO|nr:hypothetical protein PVL29_015822 [Vitis rotundifolia]
MAAALAQGQGTRVGFYSYTCPEVESIVKDCYCSFQFQPNHCFDASILITGSSIERTAGPNSLFRGYEVIDDAQTRLEATCPGVVSCADIHSLAARDYVLLVCIYT